MTENDLVQEAEYAKKVGESTASWIASADVKAAALLAVTGAILAIVLAAPAAKGMLEFGLTVAFCLANVASIIASAVAILPRMNRKDILRSGGHVNPILLSPSYFSDLGQLRYDDFLKFSGSVDDSMRKQDAIEQAYVMVVIARRKMLCMRVSVFSLIVSLVFLCAAALVSRMPPPKTPATERTASDSGGTDAGMVDAGVSTNGLVTDAGGQVDAGQDSERRASEKQDKESPRDHSATDGDARSAGARPRK